MSTTLDSHLVDHLEGRVTGPVIAPDHADYDAARAVHNGLIDRKPALIVRAHTTLSRLSRLPATVGSRCPSEAADTTSPAAPSPTAA